MSSKKFYIRNSHYNDFQAIHRLLSLKSAKFFGPTKRKIFDPESFFEIYCTHSMLVKETKENQNIIGFAEFKHYPRLEALPKALWMDWLQHHYCVHLPLNHSNTLFLNFFIYDLNYCPDLFLSVLCELFFREPHVRFIMVVSPPFKPHRFKEDEPDFSIVEPYAELFYPKDFSVQNCTNTQKVYIIVRDNIIPVMRFRRALPEDNDEIVEIINQDRPQLKEALGDFYIAEELLSDAQHKTLIVAEVVNETVGFIWLNSSLNIISLIKNFELDTYGNLLRFNPNERSKMLVKTITDMVRKPSNRFFTSQAMERLYTEAGKTHGPFILRSETSSVSLYSYFDLPVEKSDSSSLSEDEESKFIKREMIFKKFDLVEDRLGRTDWYIDMRERQFRLRYNITPSGSLDVASSLNAFAMQLYGLNLSNDVRKLYRFMVASFSAYPDRDYCIFSMPVSWPFTGGLKQLLHFFIRVNPRPSSILNDMVFITHRACFMGDISIHNVCREDVEEIEKILLYDIEKQKQDNMGGSSIEMRSRFYLGETSKYHNAASRFNLNTKNPMEESFRLPQTEKKMAASKHYLATVSQHSITSTPSRIYTHRSQARKPKLAKVPSSKHSIKTIEELEDMEGELYEQQEARILHEILEEVFTNPFSDYRFLVIRVGDYIKPAQFNSIVGFVIVRQFHQVHLLRNQFIIPECDEVRNYCRGEVIMLKLNPLLHFKSDLIFREIARHSDYWDFYYFYPTKSKYSPLSNDLICKMQPIEPRPNKKKIFDATNMIGFTPRKSIDALSQLNFSEDYFAIYQHNLRPTKYFGVTEPIVIIGYNDYTRAFLRLSVFGFNKRNNVNTNMHCCVPRLNITVISPPGIVEADQDIDFFCDYCNDQNLCYVNWLNSDEFIRDIDYRMDLKKWVKFVNGNIKLIDRHKQKVLLDSNCEIFYDRLIILSSIFFGPPKEMKISDEDLPPNYQHINNRYHKIIMYHKLQALLDDLTDVELKIIVYGCRIRAFEFINFLLTHCVSGECITLLIPESSVREYELYLNNPFIDPNIENILQEMVEDLNVHVYEDIKFSHWNYYPDNPNIENVCFYVHDREEHKDVLVTLDCDMFISFNESKQYNSVAEALKKSDIAMHGQNIIVDVYSRTSDPRIIAYGRNTVNDTFCNYQRRYTNAREVGEKLMTVVEAPVGFIDLPMEQRFHLPSSCKAQFPFDYQMMKICSPKLFLANHLPNQFNFVLTTYKDGDFVRVRMNDHNVVDEILCVTQKAMNLDFLTFFCGKHEKLLNNLIIRWSTQRFDNFLDFFQEPWTELIMHDHFDDLRQINRELTIETMEDILTYKRDYDRVSRRGIAYRRLADMGVPSEMEDQLFGFLRKYRREFNFSFALPEDFTQ